jgi:hypothetical protein
MSTYISPALRQLVHECANGCCEYCLFPEVASLAPHEIDHIVARKHGGLTEPTNLALSCALCNKHKGSDIASIYPETKDVTPLYHPRKDIWIEHFQLNNAEFVPLTAIGRVTIKLLQLNRSDRLEERQLLIEAGVFQIPS